MGILSALIAWILRSVLILLVVAFLLLLLPILLILIIFFPGIRPKARFSAWSNARGRQYQQPQNENNNTDAEVVDVEATVVEDNSLPPGQK